MIQPEAINPGSSPTGRDAASRRRKGWHNLRAAMPFLLPNLLGFLVFTAGPIVFSLAASLTNWSLVKPGQTRFVGLRNFGEVAADNRFWLALNNTAYLMLAIPASIALSLALAVMLHQKIRGSQTWKAILFLPSVTSGVAIMILWKNLYNPDFGPINALLGSLFQHLGFTHLEMPKWLLATQNLLGLDVEKIGVTRQQFGLGARDALNIMGVWGAIGGSNMLLYLAGLSNVPPELTEAAEVDGASRWTVFAKITWPQLAPTTFFIVVMSVIGGLQGGFETARIMTNGGPSNTTTTVAYYIYNQAFQDYRIGFASAVSWILFAIIFVCTLVNWKFGNKETSMA
jgi:multiple sugar transport system permease protein